VLICVTSSSSSPSCYHVHQTTVRSEGYRRLQSYLSHCMETKSFSSAPNDKLDRLEVILEEHFRRHHAVKGDGSTRAIVFVSTRATVHECVARLRGSSSDIKAVAFVGQSGRSVGSGGEGASGGINQQAQEQIVESFRQGHVNVLVATSIAEEGLDIGEVDLIVCYDSVSSPLRLMQRMGRTGRKRAGRVVMLVVEGIYLGIS
jgi:ERCC4-related helicase